MGKFLRVMSLCLILTLVFIIPVEASSNEQTIKDSLEDLALEYDFNFDEDTSDISSFLKFDSIEEFEEFISDFGFKDMDDKTEVRLQNQVAPFSFGSSTDIDTLRWYSPFAGWGIKAACWKNISFKYDYQRVPYQTQYLQFTSSNPVRNINSYLSGIQIGISWTQTNSTYTISSNVVPRDTVNFKVDGYFTLGVEIAGFPAGITKSDTWERSYTLN
ncbi:hypothetical protein PRVXT_000462 [Proteinivorax tanatarense]|uniref:Uncharacterized protein n=1 Tax=Proteinivorax tanatarense TaxID=1260629 RepID=A0AAU7VNK0_9FIRM